MNIYSAALIMMTHNLEENNQPCQSEHQEWQEHMDFFSRKENGEIGKWFSKRLSKYSVPGSCKDYSEIRNDMEMILFAFNYIYATNEEKYRLVRRAYTGEAVWPNTFYLPEEALKMLFHDIHKYRPQQEIEKIEKKFPQKPYVILFRCANRNDPLKFSYTTSFSTAFWYLNFHMFDSHDEIILVRIPKSDVIGIVDEDDEVVALPDNAKILKEWRGEISYNDDDMDSLVQSIYDAKE